MFLKIPRFHLSSLKSPCLVRDFIYDRLYNPKKGYFCQENIQIGELTNHIDFKSMIGYDDYKLFLSQNYPENAWLTPSELFKPWYGFTIANYMLQVIKNLKLDPKKQRIRVIEAGAGTGSAMDSMLFFLKNYEQSLYNVLEFNIVEISPQMCKRATEKLKKNHSKLIERGHIRVINEDLMNFKVASSNSKEFTFIIFLEVLDNMPHDKIILPTKPLEKPFQTMIEISENNKYKEVFVPISDHLITETLGYYNEFSKAEGNEQPKSFWEQIANRNLLNLNKKTQIKSIFLPTYCLKMLKFLKETFPNHNMIVSDFDLLPQEKKNKEVLNSPIVSKKLRKSYEKKDFDSYLVSQGEADIFFPTNFEFLQFMYQKVCRKRGVVMKTHEFVNEFAKEKWGETRSGYNPLKEDFLNTSFLVTDIYK